MTGPSTEPTSEPATGPLSEPTSSLPPWLAASLVVGTSAAVLVLELLAIRLLAPYVGVTLETYTAIIGTVLAGIAIGAWIGGATADRVDPRRLIPPLLVVGGALAIATIPVARVLGDALRSTSGASVIVLAAIGFLPSATVLSAVPPAVVKLQLRSLDDTGSTVGRLSAYGTAGAIVATFLTGFVLVAFFSVSALIVTVGIALIATGVALWFTIGRTHLSEQRSVALSATAIVAVALVGVAAIDSPCDAETVYYCVSIEPAGDDPDDRILVLDDLRHSYVDPDDPTALGFWYVRRIGDVIDAQPDGRLDVVHIGGGALTLPRYVDATRPASGQVVFEVDDELIDVVLDEFPLDSADGIDVRAADARIGLADLPAESADVVVGDAFASRAVPWHLTTVEFVDEIARVLRPDGVYAVNVIDEPDGDFVRAAAATIRQRLPEVTIVQGPSVASGGLGNSVIIAGEQPLDLDLPQLDGGALVGDLDAFIDGAITLTDDYAPVDQLVAGG